MPATEIMHSLKLSSMGLKSCYLESSTCFYWVKYGSNSSYIDVNFVTLNQCRPRLANKHALRTVALFEPFTYNLQYDQMVAFCTSGTYILNGNAMVLSNVQKTQASYIHMLTYIFSFACKALYVILICLLLLIMPTLSLTNKKLPFIMCTKVLKNNGEQQKSLESTCLQLPKGR